MKIFTTGYLLALLLFVPLLVIMREWLALFMVVGNVVFAFMCVKIDTNRKRAQHRRQANVTL